MPGKAENRDEEAALRHAMGLRIREGRERLRWTQERLAEAVGVGTPMLGRYERGTKAPSLVILLRLAAVMGVTTDHLLGAERGPRIDAAERATGPFRYLPPDVRQAMAVVVRELTSHAPAKRNRNKRAKR